MNIIPVGEKVFNLGRVVNDHFKDLYEPWEVHSAKIDADGITYTLMRGAKYIENIPEKFICRVDDLGMRMNKIVKRVQQANNIFPLQPTYEPA
jgi:hypothetical protein